MRGNIHYLLGKYNTGSPTGVTLLGNGLARMGVVERSDLRRCGEHPMAGLRRHLLLAGAHPLSAQPLSQAIHTVADYRSVAARPLRDVLDGFAELAQARWAAWRGWQTLDDQLLERFSDILTAVQGFAPLLDPSADPSELTWHHRPRRWESTAR